MLVSSRCPSVLCAFSCRRANNHLLSLSLRLLRNLALHTPLQRLALIMLQLPLLLLRLITSQTRKSTTNSASDTVANALAKIADLALRLLALAVGVLLLASFAQALEPQRAADGLFAGADGLVP